MTNKSLILTGWSKSEYVAGTAAALEERDEVSPPANAAEMDLLRDGLLASAARTDDQHPGAVVLRGLLDPFADRDLLEQSSVANVTATSYPDNLDAAIRQHVKSVFDRSNHNLTTAKKALGISVNTLKKYLA